MKFLLNTTGAIILILVFLALFVPTTYQGIKINFLIVAFSIVFSTHLKIFWSRRSLFAPFSLPIFGMFSSLHGAVDATEGAVLLLVKKIEVAH